MVEGVFSDALSIRESSRGWPTGDGTSAIGSSTGGTPLPITPIQVTDLTGAPEATACPRSGGVCGIGSEDQGPATYSGRCSGVSTSGGIHLSKTRLHIIAATVAPG